MKTGHLSWDLILSLHTILLDGVRGSPYVGSVRNIRIYIGPIGAPIEQATYIPPPPELLPEMIHNWEEYLIESEKDALVQLAVLKGQFEIIHPFCDGNGRIGRMIVPLFLMEKTFSHILHSISVHILTGPEKSTIRGYSRSHNPEILTDGSPIF